MSYNTWHIYGYGIQTSKIPVCSVENIEALLSMAPIFQSKVQAWLDELEITAPSYEDYIEFDQDFMLGIATILKEVILEAEGIEFTACENFNAESYLVYEPSYPWCMPDKERTISEDAITEILQKYVSVLTDEAIEIGYQSVENGG